MVPDMLRMVKTDEREFSIPRPRTTHGAIPLRYVSQSPHYQYINMCLYEPDWKQEYHGFYIPLPWVVYEWAYVPHISLKRPWLINAMYFSPVPITESLNVSAPCLPNFYHTYPCCDDGIDYCQEDFEDPSFINSFWSEAFNSDGDLLNPNDDTHPIWAHLAEKAGCPEYISASEIHEVFSYWERLDIAEVTSLNWPQNLRIPECSKRL